MMKNHTWKILATCLLALSVMCSCTKNLPDDMDSLGQDVSYNVKEFTPVIGRNTFYTNILSIGQNTSQPLSFKIVNIKDADGQLVPTLFTDKFPVKVWAEMYDGTESSIAAIEGKRKTEYRPILEILEHSGNINFWGAGSSAFIRAQPDSGYTFDVELTNSGGRRYLRDFKLKPFRERPYEPSVVDPVTGLALLPYSFANYAINMVGARTRTAIGSSAIRVYFNKDEEAPKDGTKTLTISFLDSLNKPIDPNRFNDTKWDELVHGFNHRIENNKVIYDVSYPIPLTNIETPYTIVGGQYAKLDFGYRRMNDFGFIERASFGLNFAIYEEGHWEIQFRFSGETPLFN
ncbi:DUF5007 domain-containing protein [Sphingobacterium griseoflavum]|nr:DUF5007 domain-containing protein [Sphingobacterium griseoflavum]